MTRLTIVLALVAATGCDAVLRLERLHDASVSDAASTEAIKYIQSATPNPEPGTGQTVTVDFTFPEQAGDLNVVIIGWGQASTIESVVDTVGNTYVPAGPSNTDQAIYYAPNIAGGLSSVTVSFAASIVAPEIRILEYSGIAKTTPIDDYSGMASPSSMLMTSGPVTTTHAYDLLVAGTTVGGATIEYTPCFDERLLTSPNSGIAEDRIVTTAGVYEATAIQNVPTSWTMQLVAFKGAADAPPP